MPGIRDQLIYDFDLKLPRLLYQAGLLICDNVKSIILFSETQIVLDCGKEYVSIEGEDIVIWEIEDERVQIEGEISQIHFFKGKDKTES